MSSKRRRLPITPVRPTVSPAQESQLRELWATLPTMECRGQCWDSCGPIRMTGPEHALTERAGYAIPDGDYRDGPAMCPALTMLKRCAVYDVRPSICRLWGVIESLPCSAGCRPAGGLLTDRQGYGVLARAFEIAGDQEAADGLRGMWSTPERAAEAERLIQQSRDEVDMERALRWARVRSGRGGAVIRVTGRGTFERGAAPGR